jgi:fatty-acyl-CoA synthase
MKLDEFGFLGRIASRTREESMTNEYQAAPPDAQLTATIARARSQQLGDLLRRSAARTPNKTALVFRGQRDSFAELDRVVNRCANALAARGITKGDRVALYSHNNRAFVVIRFALARLGAVMTPVNFMLSADDVAYILDHSGARAIIAEDALCTTADAALAQLDQPMLFRLSISHALDSLPTGWEAAEALFDHPDDSAPYVEIAGNDPIQMMYTSGTESRPKGALLSSDALYAQYGSCISDGEMSASDIELHCLPLFHCAQLDCFLTPDLYLGATSILMEAADPGLMLEAIAAEGVTKLFCPPTVWIALLRHPDFDSTDLSALRMGYFGA